MSVFQKLKGTFQNAQQDIVDGLKALTSLDTQSRYEQLRSLKTRDINLDAGADLLHGYQKNWALIQTDTKESAKRAEEVNSLLTSMFRIWDKQSESVAHLEEEVKAIPGILSTLEELHTLLENLRKDFAVAEKGLDVLENLCEEQELKNRCQEEQRKLLAYKVHREAEAEKVKVDLAKAHARKMTELESARRLNMQERAEAFTSAFQEDLNYYRTHGHAGRIPTEFPKVSSLSEIEIEEDKQALDSFLGPGGESEGAQSKLELSGEIYIEDDYTTDYSVKRDAEFVEDLAYINDKVLSELNMDDGDYDEDNTHTAQSSELSEQTEHGTNAEAASATEQETQSAADECDNAEHEDRDQSSTYEDGTSQANKDDESKGNTLSCNTTAEDESDSESKESKKDEISSSSTTS